LKSQGIDKEPTNLIGIENKIQDAQIKPKSQVPIKVKFFFVHHYLKEMFVIVMLFYFLHYIYQYIICIFNRNI